MKQILIISIMSFSFACVFAQEKTDENKLVLGEVSENACNCIDSISAVNKSRVEIVKEIGSCIQKQVPDYQLALKVAIVVNGKKKRKNKTNISVNNDPESQEFKQYYFDIERYAMDNCPSLKAIVNSDNTISQNSYSKNPEAVALYKEGHKLLEQKNYTQAIEDFKGALKIDSLFSFCWDELGVSYRKSGQYENALAAYKKSIAVNPLGTVPLQNMGIVYEYQKEYQKSAEAYEQLGKLDPENPEVFYGIGRLYLSNIPDPEKALDNMCTAYNLYIKINSPYRSDAEKIISEIFVKMKADGNEKRFMEILKQHHITMN